MGYLPVPGLLTAFLFPRPPCPNFDLYRAENIPLPSPSWGQKNTRLPRESDLRRAWRRNTRVTCPSYSPGERGGALNNFRRSAGSVERSSPLSRAGNSNVRSLSGMTPRSAPDCNRCLTNNQAPITQILPFFQNPCNENTYGDIFLSSCPPHFFHSFI